MGADRIVRLASFWILPDPIAICAQMSNDGEISGIEILKMHGLGNDFVIVDERGMADGHIDASAARAIGDRHRGIGFDQLAVLSDDPAADAEIVFWNADGSQAGACGNATRCVADLLLKERPTGSVRLRTERGLLEARSADGGLIEVNMGQPIFDWQDIPLSEPADIDALPINGAPSAVGMGNPHMVFPVDDVASVDIAARGAAMEHHPLYPQATNVEFAEALSPSEIRLRVWERGTGITLACGSGACATAVALHRRGLTERSVSIHLDGGTLQIDWRDDGVWMTGPVAYVFKGTIYPELLS